MTTAQLTGEFKLGSCSGSTWGFEGKVRQRSRRRSESAYTEHPRPVFRTLTDAALEALEREDTLSDKVAGYGICVLAFVYLAAQMIRTVL